MFTGIIKNIGVILNINNYNYGKRFIIETDKNFIEKLEKGITSVSINGACHTVEDVNNTEFSVYSSFETINKTNLKFLQKESNINLELPVTLSTFLDGHIVLGHIDGLSEIISISKKGEAYKFTFSIDNSLKKYLVDKDSIAIDGISLTIFDIRENTFNVAVIPETFNKTTLKYKKIGDFVNIEINIFSKYTYNLLKEKFLDNKILKFISE